MPIKPLIQKPEYQAPVVTTSVPAPSAPETPKRGGSTKRDMAGRRTRRPETTTPPDPAPGTGSKAR